MLPVLLSISSRASSDSKIITEDVIKHFKLTDEEQQALLPSKTQRIIVNRVFWALMYLYKAGLIERPERGRYRITQRGRTTLSEKVDRIDVQYLSRFEEFRAFKALKGTRSGQKTIMDQDTSEADPDESLQRSYDRLSGATQDELLDHVRKMEPNKFELLVVDLLKKMNYGAEGLVASVVRTGRSGDGGIDGEISQDPLGLDMIYIQAKRYKEGSGIGRPDLQQFVGSLNERKATKGIFITTSHFSSEAQQYINKIDVRVVLIDGDRLSELMYEYGVGVQDEITYKVKKIDSDYFDELGD